MLLSGGTDILFSTRAYRMKLKEWGLMRHKPRKTHRKVKKSGECKPDESDRGDGESSDSTVFGSVEPQTGEDGAKAGGWQAIADLVADAAGTVAESTYMEMLGQPQK